MDAATLIVELLCILIRALSYLASFLLFNVTGFLFVAVIQVIRIPALWLQCGLEHLSCQMKQRLIEALWWAATSAWDILCQIKNLSSELYDMICTCAPVIKDWVVKTAPWILEQLLYLVSCCTDEVTKNYDKATDFIAKQLFSQP